MILVRPSYETKHCPDGDEVLGLIERAGRIPVLFDDLAETFLPGHLKPAGTDHA
ncbi:MAG: hypothetical protein KJ621_20650 [Proteobacteria bacterium]|nr:hypothetical protein [Pseudomonadota bacterium]MBU1739928.1 hypothetical protein [Pseudomonadota bacterium]